MSSNRKSFRTRNENGGATLGFEEKLWSVADELRGHVEPAEYKHIVLGLLYLKYISDNAAPSGSVSVDELSRGGRLIIPETARWDSIRAANKVSGALKGAMEDIERLNPSLAGLLIFDTKRLSEEKLSRLVNALASIPLQGSEAGSRDVLGRVYEYFLSKFASTEGRSGGEYYTPRSVVQLLVQMLEPYSGVVYDPCCGTAGMFVQSQRFIAEHGGDLKDVAIFGQESSPTTWRLAKMNLSLRGIRANLGPSNADTFLNDLHPGLAADFILANPPFNAKDWGASQLAADPRWVFGSPPSSNANYAWIQHMYAHLKPGGIAGFVLSNGSLASDQGGEADLRRKMVAAGIVECIVTLPSQLFYGTQIPACLWFISRPLRKPPPTSRIRTLFIDARAFGSYVDRTHAELSYPEIARIAQTYRGWRSGRESFQNVPGFARSADLGEMERHKFALVAGRYVGFAESSRPTVDPQLLAAELHEVRERLADVTRASEQVLRVFEGALGG